MITVANFRVRFPEFGITGTLAGEVPDSRIQLYIDDAITFLIPYVECLGVKYDLALAYLVAHYITSNTQYDSFGNIIQPANGSANQGAIKRIKIGDVEKEMNYSNSSSSGGSSNEYLNTKYGRQFYQIAELCLESNFICVTL